MRNWLLLLKNTIGAALVPRLGLFFPLPSRSKQSLLLNLSIFLQLEPNPVSMPLVMEDIGAIRRPLAAPSTYMEITESVVFRLENEDGIAETPGVTRTFHWRPRLDLDDSRIYSD